MGHFRGIFPMITYAGDAHTGQQLRQMFRGDFPGIIHLLSQQWVMAYLNKRPLRES